MLPDERKRSTIMDRQNLFNFLAKDASKPEDRGTVLTKWVVYKKGVRLEWKRPEPFRTVAGTNAYAVGRRTDEIVYGSILDKRSDIWNSLSSNDGDTQVLRQNQLTSIRTSEGCECISSRKIGGSEDTTQESPAQNPSPSTFSQPDYLQPRTAPSQ